MQFALVKFNKSKSWYYFWKNKKKKKDFKDNRGWLKGKSRKFTQFDVKDKIIQIRAKLKNDSYFVGSEEILAELKEQNISTLPSLSYIDKILNKTGLTKNKKHYLKNHDSYPLDLVLDKNKHSICALDFWGPKTLDTKQTISALAILLKNGPRYIFPTTANNTDNLIKKTHNFFKISQNIPDYLLCDNASTMVGNIGDQRSFGRFIRYCLNLKITPVFIPESEPWYNPTENFLSIFAKKVWHTNYFKNRQEIVKAMASFSKVYNKRLQRQKKIKNNDNKTLSSLGLTNNLNPFLLTKKLRPQASQYVLFVRLVREHSKKGFGYIKILNTKIELPEKYTGFYVLVSYHVRTQKLRIHLKHDDKFIILKEINFYISI